MQFRFVIACAAAGVFAPIASAYATTCSADALNGLLVAGLKVTEAKSVEAAGQTPAYCQVLGTVVTQGDGAPDGQARFSMQLPQAWRQRFLFLGVGGNAGTLAPSANAVDRALALGKGYAVILTDTGHIGDGTTAKWARKADGSVDAARVTDFFFRAAHDVTIAGKAFAQAYYAAPIVHAYFDGCSTGGRMALIEAEHYPDDYTGIIAGDPAMDFNLNLARISAQKSALRGPKAYIPEETLAAIDKKVTDRCDAIDGAKDGLVQDPARCMVRPEDLACRPGESQDCLNADQVAVLKAYTTTLHDGRGRIVYPGWAMTNLSGAQGAGYYTMGMTAPNLANAAAPWGADENKAPRAWALGHETLSYYLSGLPSADMATVDIDPDTQVVGDALLARVAETFAAGNAGDASKLSAFLDWGGKLILYHGASDPSIPAQRTIMFYSDLVALRHGMEKTQENVRLFLVPGMHHCGGGVGPDRFDTLSALENWVEQGQAPKAIAASTRPESTVPHRLPLCPYPEQARFSGTGEVTDDKNWKCVAAGPAR